ncbi:unnamed protein product [Phytophthora fragariaefolia]|uniref:Unnamed protein product n=1 Tax=Phytophthora fragariaefolia TaxID=1490495 RepID=A0A9W6TIV4_9STRA|nr:unnamed protein product [Phytophthora fragariaefolia]
MPYQLLPIVRISKLKPVREFPTHRAIPLIVPSDERFDFDEEFLPEDSWVAQDLEDEGLEVEKILDMSYADILDHARPMVAGVGATWVPLLTPSPPSVDPGNEQLVRRGEVEGLEELEDVPSRSDAADSAEAKP